LSLRGAPVVALASRSRLRAEKAAAFIGASVQVVPFSELPGLATRVLVAVSDEAIPAVAETLARAGMTGGAALHTCGAKGPEALAALRAAGVACGMLHPLQTFADARLGVERLEGITFGLAGDRQALDWAEEIVSLLECRGLHIASDRLSWYHAGAVLASNALVAVIDAATILLERAGVERQDARRALEPLSRTSLDNVFAGGARAALTGPIARGDIATVAAHLEALRDAPPGIDALYRGVAHHLLQLARERGLADPAVRALESMIENSRGG
jgi:predicted short-subunit dehydrogenase-like oxidoreductase (DUF2520 family)